MNPEAMMTTIAFVRRRAHNGFGMPAGVLIMNKLILTTALALTGAATFGVPAFGQNADNSQSPTAATAQATNGQRAKPARSVPPLGSRNCIRDTGSHIPPPKGQCLPVAGNSYSQQDIQRTGATDIGRALQMLDPSVTVHGH